MGEFLAFHDWTKYHDDWVKSTNKKISFEAWVLIRILHQLKDLKYDIEKLNLKMRIIVKQRD